MGTRKRPTSIELKRTYLREWREFRGYSLQEVADYLGVYPSSLSRIELAQSPYDQIWLQQLSAKYNCSIIALLTKPPKWQRMPPVWTDPSSGKLMFDFRAE
jgi:transcriptional regulator with XRE-family HTH domain